MRRVLNLVASNNCARISRAAPASAGVSIVSSSRVEKNPSQQPPRSPRLSGSSPILRQSGAPGSSSKIVKRPEVPPQRKRSPLELIVVWGLIGGGCFIAIVEAAGKLSYDRAL